MVSPEEIIMPRMVKHQTIRSNEPAEPTKNYYLRNLYYLFLESVILQLDQRFSGYTEAVMRLSSLLQAMLLLPIFLKLNQQLICFFPYYRRH